MARLLDLIVQSAITRVKDTPFKQPPPETPNSRDRQLFHDYLSADKQRDRTKAQLKKRGWEIGYRNKLESIDAQKAVAKRRFDMENGKRLAAIRELRDKAMLDTLGMDAPALKTYLVRLKKKLEAI